MTDQVESLDVGFQDGVSAGAKKATDAVTGLGDAFTATEAKAARAGKGTKKATDEVAAGAAAAGEAIDAYAGQVERADARVKRHSQTAEQLANKFDRTKREAAAVAKAIAPYQRALDDLEASSAGAAEKEELRATITAKMEAATGKARAAVARYFKDVEAGAAAATAAAGGLSAGMAAATASAGTWAGALGKVYETAGSASGGLTQAARALQALNADFRSGHASMADWAAGAKGLEASLRGVSAAQKAINDSVGLSRQTANTAVIGPTRYATTGRGSSGTGSITFGDDGSAQRLDDITAAFAEADAKLDAYRASLGLTDAAQQKYDAGLAELQATIRRAGMEEAEATRLLTAFAAAHDPAIKKAKDLAEAEAVAARKMAQEERDALARMSADWDAAVREREADAAMIIAAEKEAAAAVKQEETALRSLVGTLDRTFGAEEKLVAEQRLLDKAMTDGVGGIKLTKEQHEALSRALKDQHEIATRSATSTKLAAHESLNLGYQIQDFAVQVGSGQGFLTPLLQQAPQAVGAVGGVGRAVALLTSPFALAAGGALTVVGGLALIGSRALEINRQTRELTSTMRTYGTEAQTTAAGLREVAKALYEGGADRGDAYGTARMLASTRGLSAAMGREAATLGSDMAAGLGKSVEDASAQVVTLMTEGYPAIMKLQEAIGFLTPTEVEAIRTMAEHGRQADALAVALGALHRRFDGLRKDSMTPAGEAMHELGVQFNRMVDAVASSSLVISVEIALSDRFKLLADFFEDPGIVTFGKLAGAGLGAMSLTPNRIEIAAPTPADVQADLQKKIEGAKARLHGLETDRLADPAATALEIDRARNDIAELERRLDGINKRAAAAQTATAAASANVPAHRAANDLSADAIAFNAQTQKATEYVKAQTHEVDRLSESLRGNAVDRALATAAMRAQSEIRDQHLDGIPAENLLLLRQREAMLQLQVAVNDNNRASAAEVAGNHLLAQAYGASSAAVREAQIQAKALAEAARGTIEPYDAIVGRLRALDDAQREVATAQFDQTLRQQTEDAERLAEAWGKGAGAAREAALAAEALAEARKRGLDPSRDAGEIENLSAGILARDVAQRSQQFAQIAAEQRQAVDLANAEWSMLGQSNAERARSVAMLQAANDLRAKGADMTDAGTQAYIRQAGELARVNSELQEAAQNAANVVQPIGTAFEDVLVGASKAGDAVKALGEDMKRIAARQLVTKPFETWLSGSLTKLMSGPIQVANDNTPKPANDPGALDRIVSSVNGGLGSSPSNAMWVQVTGGAAALDLGAVASSGPLPVAIKDGGQVVDMLRSEARAQGVPEEVALAIGKIESGFRQYRDDGRVLTSSAGAMGVMQLMPDTAKWLGVDATDTRENVRGGIKYLAMLGRQFGGDWTRAAAAYNAGPGRVQDYLSSGRALPTETVTYVERFGKTVQTVSTDVATMGTRVGGVTQAQEDALQVQLDAVAAQKVAAGSAQDLTAAQSALVASVLGTATANDNAADTIAGTITVQSQAISSIGANAISAAEQMGDAADGAKALADASDSAGGTLMAGAQAVYSGFSTVISGVWNAVTSLFSAGSSAGGGAMAGNHQVGTAAGAISSGRSLVSAAQSAYQVATGTNALGTAATNFAMSATGQSLGLATSAVGEMGPVIPTLTETGTALTGAASTIGGAMPYGMIGGLGGSLIGNATGSKTLGAISGAGLGAGSAALGSYLATGAMMGPWGLAAAAVIGGIMAALGTQKPTVGPTVSSGLIRSADGKSVTSGGYLTDNKGDPAEAQRLGDTLATVVNAALIGGGTLTRDLGIGRTERKGLYASGSLPYRDFGDDVAGLMRYVLLEQGSLQGAGPAVTKAIQRSTAKDFEESAKDLALGANIDAGVTALKELDTSLAGITRSAKETTADALKPMLEELARAKSLDLGGEYVSLARGQLEAYLQQLKNPIDWTQGEQDMATLAGRFDAIREAAMQLDPALVTTVNAIETETRARIQRDTATSYDKQINEAQGRGYVDQITDLTKKRTVAERELAAVGLDSSRATTLFNSSLDGVLKTLTIKQLADVTKTFGGAIGDLADTMRQATQAANSSSGWLTIEQAIDPTRKAKASDVLRQAGVDAGTTFLNSDFPAVLQRFLDTANAGTATANDLRTAFYFVNTEMAAGTVSADQFNSVVGTIAQTYKDGQEKIKTANDNARQSWASVVSSSLQTTQSLVTQWQSLYDTLHNKRMANIVGDYSPLGPEAKLAEAAQQFRDALAVANDNDPTDKESLAAAEKLPALGDAYLKANNDFWANANPKAFEEVQAGLGTVESVASRQLSTAQQQLSYLSSLDATLKSLDSTVADQAKMEKILSTPRNWGATESVTANMQLALKTGYEGDFGAGGWQAWITQQPESTKAIARQVLTQMGQAWRINGFASGTPAAPPGWAWVGEQGPELMMMRGGEPVVPNGAAVAMAKSWEAAWQPANDRWSGSNVMTFQAAPADGGNALLASLVAQNAALIREVSQLRQEAARNARILAKLTEAGIEENARGHGRTASALNVQRDKERAA
ncbi:transglycosylase SLT domain-containing protein [Azospirillum picis]|uniref:Transglycosylase SLT domain-containing protein n=1 Tax=Azospirillum picis TaxID=488438 RepID=A0ABU0MS38_9PROT|nr:transglycosylase SLT domain-containing protein [Azospirillum picis]MBP2302517.1 hypothetical protein [Azospirillum picis]MDQ0536241.1 hypothetical protein [Azospirillum picis]